MNVNYRVRLHSHDVKYGTGSGQQSVTGVELSEDVNSHWAIKAKTGKSCVRGYGSRYFTRINIRSFKNKYSWLRK